VEAAGIESAGDDDASVLAVHRYENDVAPGAAIRLQHSDADCRSAAQIDAALHKVIAAWGRLPANIRQAIVMLADPQTP